MQTQYLDIDKLLNNIKKDIMIEININKINKVNKDEINMICGNTVSKIKQIEQTRKFNSYGEYIDGIQRVIQHKKIILNDIFKYEVNVRKGLFKYGVLRQSYMYLY